VCQMVIQECYSDPDKCWAIENMNDDIHKKPGPLLLLAGPGTGKTYRLGKRIKYLVEEAGVPPQDITVITFTTAAAKNMRDRISDETRPELYVNPTSQPRSIRTMHSLGYMILQDEDAQLPFDCNTVVTSINLQRILCQDAAQLAGFDRSQAKEAEICRRLGHCRRSSDRRCLICQKYQQLLQACSAIDHDEQILLSCDLLKKNPDLLRKYRSQCKHLLVDEYQDINDAQFQLIKMLSDGQLEGLFVVGDDDQSIYSWRGGSPEFIRRFEHDFGDTAAVEPLQISFRCHKHVLEGSTDVVSKFDSDRFSKGPFTYKVEGKIKIQTHSVASDEKEALIVRSIVKNALPSRDVLILVPHRGFAKSISKALFEAKIPFSVPPTIPGEGLPAMASLSRWLNNPLDSLSFRMCLEDFINNNPEVPSKLVRKKETKQERENIFGMVSNLWEPVLAKEQTSLWGSLTNLSARSTILEAARETFSKISELAQAESTSTFASQVLDALGMWKKPPALLNEIDAWVSFFERSYTQDQGEDVRIMTFQGAKGLEARVVCVLGVEEGTLPSNTGDPHRIAEDARLFYVSATRAIDELHLFHARKRSGSIVFRDIYNSGASPDMQPSRFLSYIDEEHKESIYHPA